MTRRQMLAQMAANPGMQGSLPMAGLSMPTGPGMGGPSPTLGPQMVGGELQLPNKVLYLQNLPDGVTEQQLLDVFKKFPGFVEIRLVPNRPDVAFAEYENESQAVVARQAAENHEIQPGKTLRVAFARR
jgi:RNA recognition motif-containing protein